MKYNQPFGIGDPDAAYINGNPATGTMGSIPPASSIEYDQREIVAVIQYAADNGFVDHLNVLCADPDNADLQQLLKAIFGIFNSTKLTAPRDYYVNAATGDDTFNGLSAGTPFQTLQRAANQAGFFNLNGYTVTIHVADGTYGRVYLPPLNGTGAVVWVGNIALPANCVIHSNAGSAVRSGSGPYTFSGFRYESDAPLLQDPGAGLWAMPGGVFVMEGSNEFGFCSDAHFYASQGAINMSGNIRICGNSARHIMSQNGSWVYTAGTPGPTLVIPAAQTITHFAVGDSAPILREPVTKTLQRRTGFFWPSLTTRQQREQRFCVVVSAASNMFIAYVNH